MASPEDLKNALKTLSDLKNKKVIIVVSALSQVTNNLFNLTELIKFHKYGYAKDIASKIADEHKEKWNKFAKEETFEKIKTDLHSYIDASEILVKQSEHSRNKLISKGEIYSSWLLFDIFESISIKSEILDAVEIISQNADNEDHDYLSFNIDAKKIKTQFKSSDILITQGYSFLKDGKIELMKRGGSDFTASLLAKEFNSDKLNIWTDVSGIYSADPNKYSFAKIMDRIGYKQLIELSKYGAKVLQVDSIKPAIENNVPVFIKNTFQIDSLQTEIKNESTKEARSVAFQESLMWIEIDEKQLGSSLKKILSIAKYNNNRFEMLNSHNNLNLFVPDEKFNRDFISWEYKSVSVAVLTGEIAINVEELENIIFVVFDNNNYIKKLFFEGELINQNLEIISEKLNEK